MPFTTGPYLCAEDGGGSIIIPNRAATGIWETFTLERISGARYRIKCYDGSYIWASGGGGSVVSTAGIGDTWQTFTLVPIGDGYYGIRTYDDVHYLCAENGGETAINATRTSIGLWEKFGFYAIGDNKCYIWTANWAAYPGFTGMPALSVIPTTALTGSATVGHAGSGAEYICDGTDDQVQINQVFTDGHATANLIADSTYYIGTTPVNVPSGGEFTSNDPNSPATIAGTANNTTLVSGGNGNLFNIHHLNFDGKGYAVSCVHFDNSLAGSAVHYCNFLGYATQSAGRLTGIGAGVYSGPGITNTGFLGNGISGLGSCTVDVHHNIFTGGQGIPILIEGKTTGVGQAAPTISTTFFAKVYNNQTHPGTLGYGDYNSQITCRYAFIAYNTCISYGFTNGINGSRCLIYYNVIRGAGYNGITSSCWPMYDTRADTPMVDGHSDWGADPTTAMQNDAYSLVDHNITEYCMQNGIDYWISDGSVITNNRSNDNGQNYIIISDDNYWDLDGIDVSDHSQNTTVSNNECTNKAYLKTDTVSSVGSGYIIVANISRWYDVRNSINVPFNGIGILIGSNVNRVLWIDIATSRLYLRDSMSGIVAGNTITGINRQRTGIHTGNNGWGIGNHNGAHNNCYGNTYAQIGVAVSGATPFPNTVITSDGTGPVPAFVDVDVILACPVMITQMG